MLIANKYEVPDMCPQNCPGKGQLFYQWNLCIRCPIFNCKEIPGPEGVPFRLIEPEDYRKDWAEEFVKWFENNMQGYPNLRLSIGN